MPNYYLHRDGQNHGPYPLDQMTQMINSDQISGDEQVCEEGGSDWVAASTLTTRSAPRLVTGVAPASARQISSSAMAVTQQQVASAYQKLKVPFLGIVFSAALPVILWAAKSDLERGVGTTGRNRALKELTKENTDLLPIAIGVGIIGVVLSSIWLMNSLKRAKLLKAQLAQQQTG